MFNLASEETYQDGDIIIKEDSSGDWVYVILSGSVEISKTVEGKKYLIEILPEGEVFGEISFLAGLKRTATVRAIGETTVGIIDRSSMDQEFNKISSDFRSILVALVHRFKKMIDRAYEFSYRRESRIQKTLSLTYKDNQSFINAYTGNISIGGLYIKTEKPLRQGEMFFLKLQLPGLSEPVNIKSEVAWAWKKEGDKEKKPSGMGVKFLEMNEKDDQTLKKYIGKIMEGG